MSSTYPDKVLKYCPRCGSSGFNARSVNSFDCPDCGFVFYCNIGCGVAGIIVNSKQEVMFTIRAHEPKKDLYDLPGGFIDVGETAEEALVREIKEELDVDAANLSYFGTHPNTYEYKGITNFILDLCYVCTIDESREMRLSDEIAECRFLPLEEVDEEKIAFDSIRYFVQQYKKSRRSS